MDVEGDDEDHGAIAAAAVPTSWTRRKVMDAMSELGDGVATATVGPFGGREGAGSEFDT